MEIKKWKKLSSEYLIKRPWLTARRDTVELPDGRVNSEYYILEYPSWINVIAITTDGEFVMVEQYRHGLQNVFIELVAGVVEPGEEPLSAARRELLEETGYAGGEWRLFSVISSNPSTNNNLTYCFIAEGVEKVADQQLDATEDIAVHLLSEQEVRTMLDKDLIKQALMAAPLWKYFATKAGC
ncbi:MAG: NUDIX hydrolase [Muribaculaceae bacterium]|nr:NUDIX hydrolase [Muribaculaceae bacterium]